MKRIRVILMTVAIIIAVSTAFATSYVPPCENQQQWYLGPDSVYHPAGTSGVNYTCDIMPGNTCTYVLVGSDFVTCVVGSYRPF